VIQEPTPTHGCIFLPYSPHISRSKSKETPKRESKQNKYTTLESLEENVEESREP
jgi:hypothetical protein